MELEQKYRHLHRFSFGDTPAMADSGLADVIARKQVATCGALALISPDNPMPAVGVEEIVLDGSGNPGCILRTTDVIIRRYNEIDETFARQEACDSLDQWRQIHQAYFTRSGCFSENMELICQYFDVVEVFSSANSH